MKPISENNIKDICIIRARQWGSDDYVYDGFTKYGFNTLIPYKDHNTFMRVAREVWFRLKLPKRSIWYNDKIKAIKEDTIIVLDPLITDDFMQWLRRLYPNKRIIFSYEDRADMVLSPEKMDSSIEKWSYDKIDCKKYNLKYMKPSYYDIYSFDARKVNKIYDVIYVGRDKGRLSRIESYENLLKRKGLKTFFYICANREIFTFTRRIYKPLLPYKDYLKLLGQSKALLNIAREDQNAVTMRELEAVFDNVKCITTNKYIKEFELYDSSRFFVLGVDNIENIMEFMNEPFNPVEPQILNEYTFINRLMEMLNE